MPAKKPQPQKPAKDSKGGGLLVKAGIATAVAAGYFLFGPKGKDNRKKIRAWTLKAKGEVLEKIEKLEAISDEKYHEIVDKVTEKYAKKKDIAEDELAKFTTELKAYWKKIEKDVTPKKKASKKK
jgi:hypothetical protein